MSTQTQVAPTQPRWEYAVGGIITILFGLAAVLWPHLTLGILVLFFGWFVLVSGVVSLVDMFRRMSQRQTWWPQLLVGIISIAAGLYILVNPHLGAVILLYVIVFWAITIGLTEIFASFATGHFAQLIVGILTVAFGFILLANPVAGALSFVWAIGVFAIVRGVLLLFEAFQAPETPAAAA